MTLANVYCHNSKQVTFSRDVLTKLVLFQTGLLLLGGDFNIPLDPLVDTSNGASSLPFSALCQIKLQLVILTLHDMWQTLYHQDRDYIFFSSSHNRYSRLGYLFIHQADLSYLHNAIIENMVLSGHHPITMILLFADRATFTKMWRMDASLLTDLGDLATIRQQVTFFTTMTPECSGRHTDVS